MPELLFKVLGLIVVEQCVYPLKNYFRSQLIPPLFFAHSLVRLMVLIQVIIIVLLVLRECEFFTPFYDPRLSGLTR